MIDENTSDGYHTFKELYEHRMALTSALTRHVKAYRSLKHNDGTMFNDMFIVMFYIADKQCSYHYSIKDWEYFNHLEIREFAEEWNGHSSDDVINTLLEKDTNDI